MRSMLRWGVLPAVLAWAAGCGGSAQQQAQADAAAIAGVAAALQVVQAARAKAAPVVTRPEGVCCVVCGACDFPCGNACVPNGTMCMDPPGCACAGAPAETRDQPVAPEPGGGCPEPTPGIVVTAQ